MCFAFTSVHISEFKGSRRGIDLARSAVLRQRFSTPIFKGILISRALIRAALLSLCPVRAWITRKGEGGGEFNVIFPFTVDETTQDENIFHFHNVNNACNNIIFSNIFTNRISYSSHFHFRSISIQDYRSIDLYLLAIIINLIYYMDNISNI